MRMLEVHMFAKRPVKLKNEKGEEVLKEEIKELEFDLKIHNVEKFIKRDKEELMNSFHFYTYLNCFQVTDKSKEVFEFVNKAQRRVESYLKRTKCLKKDDYIISNLRDDVNGFAMTVKVKN